MDRNREYPLQDGGRIVALRKESVDRNTIPALGDAQVCAVALRKESVDRNTFEGIIYGSDSRVALRKESVDRNGSMSSAGSITICVALRKESVDRNYRQHPLRSLYHQSLSARRAWIEILGAGCQSWYCGCRSPQGERG